MSAISAGPADTANGQMAFSLRLLMQGKEVGSIIGKKGDNIKKFRELSGAKINVSDSSCPDRIVTLSGTLDEVHNAFSMICSKFEEQIMQINFPGSIAGTSVSSNTSGDIASSTTTSVTVRNANNDSGNGSRSILGGSGDTAGSGANSATGGNPPSPSSVVDPLFGLPTAGLLNNALKVKQESSLDGGKEADLLTMNNNDINSPNKNLASPSNNNNLNINNKNSNASTLNSLRPPVTLRLIVPAGQCGSLIGRGGVKIKEIREMTGATIQVAPDVLPNSTERVVTISGNVDSLRNCAYQICKIMVESPPKSYVIPYRPKPTLNPMLLASGQAAYNLSGQFALPAAHPEVNRLFVDPIAAAFNPRVAANIRAAATGQTAAALSAVASSHALSSQEMTIPNGLIGCVIGKAGTKINEIRQISGANIKIANSEEGAKNRTVTIQGTPEAINLAQYLITASCNGHQTSLLENIAKPWSANKSARKFAPY